MKVNRQQKKIGFNKNLVHKNAVFFDIETTGFSSFNTNLFLIGCIHIDENGDYVSIQWLAEHPSEESLLLYNFFEYISGFDTIIHFNGSGFDIPYIEEKCRAFLLPYNFNKFNSIDIYRKISKLKNIFKLENLKQKTIENYLGVNRIDKYSGGELISVYQNYVKSKDKNDELLLLQHNLDDISGMVQILDIIAYTNIFEGKYTIEKIDITDSDEIVFYLSLMHAVPKRITYGFGPFLLSAMENNAYIKIEIYTNELKFFYPNYTDYYYLPVEDVSIHKCVAFYVDKHYRTKAKAANCYSKKTGRFLPQHKEIISPYFKIDYNDKITYFEVTDEFLSDNNLIKSYTLHILNLLLTKK